MPHAVDNNSACALIISWHQGDLNGRPLIGRADGRKIAKKEKNGNKNENKTTVVLPGFLSDCRRKKCVSCWNSTVPREERIILKKQRKPVAITRMRNRRKK